MKRILILVALSALLIGCAAEPTTAPPRPSSDSASPSPSAIPEFCDTYPDLREVLKDVDKGTELPDDIIETLAQEQDMLDAQAVIAGDNPDGREAISEVADNVGRLKLNVADAGTDYPTDFPVQIGVFTVRLSIKTAVLMADC